MLTAAQIAAGTARLVDGKLTQDDVDQFVTVFRMFIGSLETTYGYEFETKLEALDDTGNTEKKAAQVAACAIILEELGFGVAEVKGNTNFREKDEYWQYVMIAFSKLYPIPPELSTWDLKRRTRTNRVSSTALSSREEYFGNPWSEREIRRRGY